jgi:histidyl-tRNA synthetase
MHDILPDEYHWYDLVERAVETIADAYGFGRIETPILEEEELFVRGIGSATDIVEKEMYTLRTRGGDRLALRPEGTAPIVRAYLEHGMRSWPQPVRLSYFGPMFRHERPQAGRYREFWQGGFEIIGSDDAVADAEIILVTMAMFEELGLKQLSLFVNSIGCNVCRPTYRKNLLGYLRPRQGELCADCRRRLKTNPFRVLDCKNERCLRVTHEAPETIDHLCESCRAHFRAFLEFLEEVRIGYVLDARLVRGLDYYSRTVFEVFPHNGSLETMKAQGALASGGRYDNLFKILSGKTLGAVGVAIGVERTIAALKEAGMRPPESPKPHIFLAQLGEQAKRKAPALFEELRRARFRVRASFGRDSIKSQLRIADKLGVRYVLILGQKEVADGTIIVRSMETGSQEVVKREALVPFLRDRLRKKEGRR